MLLPYLSRTWLWSHPQWTFLHSTMGFCVYRRIKVLPWVTGTAVQFTSAEWDGWLCAFPVGVFLAQSKTGPFLLPPQRSLYEHGNSVSGIDFIWPGRRELVWPRVLRHTARSQPEVRAKPLTGEIIIHNFKLAVMQRPCHWTFRPASVTVYDSIKMTFEISARQAHKMVARKKEKNPRILFSYFMVGIYRWTKTEFRISQQFAAYLNSK